MGICVDTCSLQHQNAHEVTGIHFYRLERKIWGSECFDAQLQWWSCRGRYLWVPVIVPLIMRSLFGLDFILEVCCTYEQSVCEARKAGYSREEIQDRIRNITIKDFKDKKIMFFKYNSLALKVKLNLIRYIWGSWHLLSCIRIKVDKKWMRGFGWLILYINPSVIKKIWATV